MIMQKNTQVKTDAEIEIMKKAGQICAQALKKVLNEIKPGAVLSYLDQVAKAEIERNGATSSFMTVDSYGWTICTTVNEQVVHGIPTQRRLKEGDIVGIDIGAQFKGYHSDMATTIGVGKISQDAEDFLKVGKNTLNVAISKAKANFHIGDISSAIQSNVESANYAVVKNLTGHGVGRELHEEPIIPGFGRKGKGPKILENMVLAIEVIYAKGAGEVKLESDDWTISTVDGSLGGLFEQTVAVTENGPIVLTPYL